MGCDIHIWVEQKKEDRWEIIAGDAIDGVMKMKFVEKYKVDNDEEGNIETVFPLLEERDDGEYHYDYIRLSDRSYGWFSLLAGVRDYSDGKIAKISDPRGLPQDVSGIIKVYHDEYWGVDAHSSSWVNIREVMDNRVEEVQYQTDWIEKYLIPLSKDNGNDQRLVFFFDN